MLFQYFSYDVAMLYLRVVQDLYILFDFLPILHNDNNHNCRKVPHCVLCALMFPLTDHSKYIVTAAPKKSHFVH